MTALVTKMFVLRRIPVDAAITYAQMEKCILDDLRAGIDAIKGNPCLGLLDGQMSVSQIVNMLKDAGVIEVTGPVGADYGYRRTQLAAEWEAGLRSKFPGLQHALDSMSMSRIGLLDALARG